MKRVRISARPDWKHKVERLGLLYHHIAPGQVYWNESAYYELTAPQVGLLEAATNELQRICLEAGQFIVDSNRFAQMGIPEKIVPLIKTSWEAGGPALYGRFDLAWDGVSDPKLLEYNADTPTALLEAAVIQWDWLEELFPWNDQFNSIDEGLVEKWKELKEHIRNRPLYFAHLDDLEDLMTVTYLRDTAERAGIETEGVLVTDIDWDLARREFFDREDKTIRAIFKLYPYEWMIHEPFADFLIESYNRMEWMEPVWRMMWSNKGLLAILWEMYPGHPNLLESYFELPGGLFEYVKKPLLSREGANVLVKTARRTEQTGGDYGCEGYVFQRYYELPDFDGHLPVIGSWIVDGEAAGIGIRETNGSLVTDNRSSFVPHMFSK
jgi:glutathionylspermidine synthase